MNEIDRKILFIFACAALDIYFLSNENAIVGIYGEWRLDIEFSLRIISLYMFYGHYWTVFFIQLVYVHLMHMNMSVISSIHTLAYMQCSRKYVYEMAQLHIGNWGRVHIILYVYLEQSIGACTCDNDSKNVING